MKSITTLLCSIPFLVLTTACSNSNARTSDEPGASAKTAMGDIDRSFVEQAAASGNSEVEQGRLASTQATNEAVRQYGNHLQQDHTAANNELATIAQRHDVPMTSSAAPDRRGSVGAKDDATTTTKMGSSPQGTANPTGTHGAAGTMDTTGQALDRERAGMMQPWMQASGDAFDRGFITAQVKAHQDAIALFTQQVSTGGNEELKAFASKQLPALREHLRQAEELQKTLCPSGC